MFVKCGECGTKLGPEYLLLPTTKVFCKSCVKKYPRHAVNR